MMVLPRAVIIDLCVELRHYKESIITLSEGDFDRLVAALEEPPKPNERLRRLLGEKNFFADVYEIESETEETHDAETAQLCLDFADGKYE